MKDRRMCWLGLLAGLIWAPAAMAQVPGVDAATAAAAAPGAVAGAAGAVGAGPANIWSKICMTPEQRAACRERFCKSPFGKLFSNGMKPLGLATGGLVGECCPINAANPSDLKKDKESSVGAAARIKADEAEAKARREAVRYLGTVDCRYWPEAEQALINALREDKNECVRWEAAIALQRGCCCTQKIVEALTITIEGTEKDGHPAERSERVREAAVVALSGCVIETKPEPAPEPTPEPKTEKKAEKEGQRPNSKETDKKGDEKDAGDKAKTGVSRDYYKNLRTSKAETMNHARRVLGAVQAKKGPPPTGDIVAPKTSRSGVIGIISQAFQEPTYTTAPGVITPIPAGVQQATFVPAQSVQIVPASAVMPVAQPVQQPVIVPNAPPVERRGLIYKLIPSLSPSSSTTPARTAPSSSAPVQTSRSFGFADLNRMHPFQAVSAPRTTTGVLITPE